MFIVIFEVHPKPGLMDAYLGYAALLKPELERIEGFVDNVRYRSLTRDGWILSLSGWRDEKALVRWRTQARHHAMQEKGRTEVFSDYHLRIGEIMKDTQLPTGQTLREQRLDETEAGEAKTVTLINGRQSSDWVRQTKPDDLATSLGLAANASGLVAWDVFEAVLTPGDIILLASWREQAATEDFERAAAPKDGARLRRVRVIRDYGLFDRREAPQYYPDVKRVDAVPA